MFDSFDHPMLDKFARQGSVEIETVLESAAPEIRS